MNIDAQIRFHETIIADNRFRIGWLVSNRDKLETLGIEGLFAGGKYDLDNLTHEQVVRVMLAFPGSWKKTPNASIEATIDYEGDFNGVTIRCWAGQPPPNCRVIEVEEEVPPQPATVRRVKKIVCNGTAAPEPEPTPTTAAIEAPTA